MGMVPVDLNQYRVAEQEEGLVKPAQPLTFWKVVWAVVLGNLVAGGVATAVYLLLR